MMQVCMKHSVCHILYGLPLFLVTFAFYVTMNGPCVSSSGLYFIKKKRYIGNPLICQCTLIMDLLYPLVKFSHELEDIMAIYDNMITNE